MKGNTLSYWENISSWFEKAGKSVTGPIAIRTLGALLLGLGLATGTALARNPAPEDLPLVQVGELPKEARETLALIKKGGPFPYPRDGIIFGNREGRLPSAPRGTYREFTVPTPGHHDRGARRIIARGTDKFWYSYDHYRSFRQIVE